MIGLNMSLKSFTKNVDNYYRDYDIVKDGVEQYAIYLHKATNRPLEECRAWLIGKIKSGDIPLHNPTVDVLRRDRSTGDRELVKLRFTNLINDIKSRDLILSPSFTALVPSNVEQSLSAIYMVEGKAKRSEFKKKQNVAEAAGDTFHVDMYKSSQTKAKTDINSLSGVRSMPNTPLYVKSAHPILTSGCRVAVSYTNAINERMISGNRHYWSPNIVLAEITATIQTIDLAPMEAIMNRYGMVIPTVDDCMECVMRGSELEWYSIKQMDHIRSVMVNLTDIQRAAFLYASDLYHISKLNPSVVDKLLLSLSAHYSNLDALDQEDTTDYIKLLNGPQELFLKTIIYNDISVGGKSISFEDLKNRDLSIYRSVNRVAKNILDVISEWDDFFYVFFMHRHMPLNISFLPEIKRRAVPGSDTDSSIFTVEDWTERLTREYPDRNRVSMANAIVYLETQVVDHVVALCCGNMGIEKKNMFKIKMKNEFFFIIFSLTNNAKHYFAYQQFKDGSLLPKLTEEIKGAGLKDSKLPADVKSALKKFLTNIMDSHLYNIPVTIEDVFTDIYNVEKAISDSILSGGCEYLKRDIVKDTYSKESGSKLIHYELWKSAFARKYGDTVPPYRAIKIPLDLDNKSKVDGWIGGIEDKHIGGSILNWIEKMGKEKGINILLMPEYNIKSSGIPEEIRGIVNVRGLQREMMMPFYMALESLGLFLKGKSIDILVSDVYTPIDGSSLNAKVEAFHKSRA